VGEGRTGSIACASSDFVAHACYAILTNGSKQRFRVGFRSSKSGHQTKLPQNTHRTRTGQCPSEPTGRVASAPLTRGGRSWIHWTCGCLHRNASSRLKAKRTWQADELSLFYPHPTDPRQGPVPSIRLKAYCYGQQDAELLAQLAAKAGVSRYAFGDWLLPQLGLRATPRAEGEFNEPAAWNDYSGVDASTMHRFRLAWMEALESVENRETYRP